MVPDPIIVKPEITTGTLIGNRYLIEKVLGRGGIGRTYLALDTHRFQEPRVLKEFAPIGIGEYSLQKSCDLFKREAEILYKIKHPQIPTLFACFEADGRLFLELEYISGKTYSTLLRERQRHRQAFSEQEIIQLLKALLPVLEYIHKRNIIHRDISPDNIMLRDDTALPVLIDFGVGKQVMLHHYLESNNVGNTDTSYDDKVSLVGKIGYAPPEQLSSGRCSFSSDLYALAVTALVLLTGRQPSEVLEQDFLELQWRSHTQISDAFASTIHKMLELMPKNRYQSATEVLAALQEVKQVDETIVQVAKHSDETAVQSGPEYPDQTAVHDLKQSESTIVKPLPFPPTPRLNMRLPGGAISTRPLHFIWICDCSSSMAVDGKIQALNNAVEEVIPHMKAAAADNPNAQVLVQAIQFSSGARWHVPNPTPIESFKWTDLEADGITDLGQALYMVAEQLKSPLMSNRALPPVLVLISDGYPTDDYLNGLKVLMNEPWGKKAVRIAIAIGRDANYEVLQQFIGYPELKPLRANHPEALVKQIKWASTAVLKAASAPASISKNTSIGMPIPISAPFVSTSSYADDIW